MYLLIERGIRGGISIIIKRHAIANNKYMANYDRKKKSKYLPYMDANNLYGWAMNQPLPIKDFKWMNSNELEKWEEHIASSKWISNTPTISTTYTTNTP
jgi:hypothetical protein